MLIPAPPSCILERDAQHSQIVAKLLSFPNAKVAILGMGGIGKTSLACSVASDAEIMDVYPRRLFLSFEGCSTSDLAYTNLATAFQVPTNRRSSYRQIVSHILNYLKRQKTLFIIDNFETFWEFPSNRRVAEDFLAQLAALPQLALIVTLRGIQRPGNIRWVKIEPLKTLTPNASKELLSIITDEKYTEDDSRYIQRILDAVAGIPLAVTLVGSLLRDHRETPRSLWHRWTRESTRAIGVANDTEPDHPLYKLDVSLRLSIFGPRISDNTKEVLAAISILPVGLNMDESWLDRFQDTLPSTINIRSCINSLRNVALCTLESTSSPPRLRLLPPVRDFCLGNISLNGVIAYRLIDLYNRDLQEHWDFGTIKHYIWVTTELSNLSAILNRAIALRYLTNDLGEAIGRYTEWRRFLCIPETNTAERAIGISAEYPKVRAECLRAFGTTLLDCNREREAIPLLKQAISIHREIGDKHGEGIDLRLLGGAHNQLDDYANAEHYLSEASGLSTEIDDKWNKGAVLRTLADIYHKQNKLPRAESTAEKALALCRASGDRKGEINTLRTLGRVYHHRGKYDPAVAVLSAARDVSKAIHDIHAEGCATESLGYVYQDSGKPDQAALCFRLAVSLCEQTQDFIYADRLRATLEELERCLDTPRNQ